MGTTTGIEWTDATWNPIRGCTPVSPGCKNCYAAKVAQRFSFAGGPYEGLVRINAAGERTDDWNGQIKFVEKHLLDPLKWKTGRPLYDAATVDLDGNAKRVGRDTAQSLRIFVNSMSDLFHEGVTDEMRDKIFAVMALCPQHVFQVLTKRPERMLGYIQERRQWRTRARWNHFCIGALTQIGISPEQRCAMRDKGGIDWPLPNVWLGVSVENQAAADERIPLLLKTPAAVRFISAEPLLGPLDLLDIHGVAVLTGCIPYYREEGPHLDWVIVGGESGPGARPMQAEWAQSLRDQCQAAGVAFFMKQMGSVFGPAKGHNIPADLNIKQFPQEVTT